MIVQVQSDIHLEMPYNRFNLNINEDAEVLVFCGDVFNFTIVKHELTLLQKMFQTIKVPVIFVNGNHDYYTTNGESIQTIKDKYKKFFQNTNVHMLDNESVTINGVKFIGSTLWSDFDGKDLDPIFTRDATRYLADFRYIKDFSLSACSNFNKIAREFLESELETGDEPKFVVSHFVPTYNATAPKFLDDTMNPYFMSSCDELISKADWWAFGHTHTSFDFYQDGCHLICNPLGYGDENPMFRQVLIETKGDNRHEKGCA